MHNLKSAIKYSLIPVAFWATALFFSYCWNASENERVFLDLMADRGRTFFNLELSHRHWNASHGGVYVPISPIAQSNPYLEDPLRDVVTTEGLRLTKINPAYMTRLVGEIEQAEHNLSIHITSAMPIRPANTADDWELKALESFESNSSREYMGLLDSENGKVFRYMAPLYVTAPCLRCHEKQGYKMGDVRGGISISFPAGAFLTSLSLQNWSLGLLHWMVFAIGSVMIIVYQSRTHRAEQALMESLAEKEELVRATHHRVKNNLLVIQSLMSLRSREVLDTTTKGYLRESENRMRAVSLIHEMLSRTEGASTINMAEYLRSLCVQIFRNYQPEVSRIRLLLNVQKVDFDVDTVIPCGLIVHELVSNSFKYAFPEGRDGEIAIELLPVENGGHCLVVRDNGVGLPPDVSPEKSESFGMKIISSLAGQLKAEVEIRRQPGTEFRITLMERKKENGT